MLLKTTAKLFYHKWFAPAINYFFFRDLISRTKNFASVKWLGNTILQNIFDLWVTQEIIFEVKPELLIECGTNKGGSSLFYANVFDLMGQGSVITIDIEKMHNLSHPRVTYLMGSSTSPDIVDAVRHKAAACQGPVMVILDSDHSQQHVMRELECYAPMVTTGSYCLVQDGVIDTLGIFRAGRPGPLPTIDDFIRTANHFEIDEELSKRFIITHHPKGWLKRIS